MEGGRVDGWMGGRKQGGRVGGWVGVNEGRAEEREPGQIGGMAGERVGVYGGGREGGRGERGWEREQASEKGGWGREEKDSLPPHPFCTGNLKNNTET